MKNSIKLFCIALTFLITQQLLANDQIQTVSTKINSKSGVNGEAYTSFTFNGSWCWFSDPRAVYYEGKFKRTYSGWVDNYGNIIVGYYDHDTKIIATKVIMERLEIDDHDNPAILIDKDGKIMVFFTRHGYGDSPEPKPIFMAKSRNAEDIESWNGVKKLYLNDEKDKVDERTDFTHTYTNPIELSAENGKLFIFWRGVDGKPGMSTSIDGGENWTKGDILYMSDPIYRFRRPYTKVYSNGDSKIHFTFTLGHPDREDKNSILYTYYQNGAFYKADGTLIKKVSELPLKPEELDLVYDAEAENARAWNWDIAEDEKGNPVVVYAKFPTTQDHYYCYAKWNGKKWINHTLVNSGSWFPKTPKGRNELQKYYSGGLCIDKEDVNTLYLSVKRNSVFEIEKWSTSNGGKSWKIEPVTKNSTKDNIRPYAVKGAKKGNSLQVVWMQNTKYIEYSYASWTTWIKWSERYQSAIKFNVESPIMTDPFNPEQIKNVMRKTTDWQFANPYDLDRILEWHWGTFTDGVIKLYELTKDDRYKQELINIGEHAKWRTLDVIFDGNNLKIANSWANLYAMEKDPRMIEKTRWVLDVHLASRRPQFARMGFGAEPYPSREEWWSVLDYLFMAPPTFATMSKVTGDQKYLNYMDQMWWKTTDYLYSKADSLYYRDDRYFDKKSDNGAKIFWGRGNGWLVGGLVEILDVMPKDFHNRDKYIQLYNEMSQKILSLQREDGLWTPSLLDPGYKDQGDVSCATFYVYMFAWGLNNGILDEKYRPQVDKAWRAICENVATTGRLGGAQGEGIDPSKAFTKGVDDTHIYATGAFLLAGYEMYKLVQGE